MAEQLLGDADEAADPVEVELLGPVVVVFAA